MTFLELCLIIYLICIMFKIYYVAIYIYVCECMFFCMVYLYFVYMYVACMYYVLMYCTNVYGCILAIIMLYVVIGMQGRTALADCQIN